MHIIDIQTYIQVTHIHAFIYAYIPFLISDEFACKSGQRRAARECREAGRMQRMTARPPVYMSKGPTHVCKHHKRHWFSDWQRLHGCMDAWMHGCMDA
jgi:hypothetical protein